MTTLPEQLFHSGFVTLIGRPNAGKSTLLNRIIGEKIAITSAKPQTTRNRIQGICNLPSAQIVFIDTPGIHAAQSRLNRAMVETARSSMSGADLVLLLIPADQRPEKEEPFISEVLKGVSAPVCLVLTKIDLMAPEALLPLMDQYRHMFEFQELLPVSALTGYGTAELLQVVAARMPQGPPYFPDDILTDLPERFLAAETVREKVFQFTKNEIPYSSLATIERFHERADGLLEIEAAIIVERDSQKGIVIGKGGVMLKKIGTAARKDLEAFFQSRVMLRLYVRVQANWSDNSRLLKEFGYQ